MTKQVTPTPTAAARSEVPPFDTEQLRCFAERFDRRLTGDLESAASVPKELADAVAYAALAPGKRLRPYLTARCCALVGGDEESSWSATTAIECVHAFSLIHDDLPAMDDADLRRGRATCHKKFGEAMAVLAGDALLAYAFELLTGDGADPRRATRMVRELARGTGGSGMIGGQADDIRSEHRPPTIDTIRSIHDRKTARLFETACRLGAIAGDADAATEDRLGQFGLNLGRAFQIADDLLDVSGGPETLGKGTGADAAAGKQTYPACVGVEESRAAAHQAATSAIAELEPFGDDANDLRALARYVVDRNY